MAPDPRASRTVPPGPSLPSPWDDLVGPFLLTAGVQARLGIPGPVVDARADARRLLRLTTSDGVHLYPQWQFDGPRVLRGLPEVLDLFPEEAIDGWTLAGWLRTPEPDLGDESPLEVLRRGERARVLDVAQRAAKALAGGRPDARLRGRPWGGRQPEGRAGSPVVSDVGRVRDTDEEDTEP